MNDEPRLADEMFRGPALEEVPTSGLQVEEPLEVESIELTSRMRGPAATGGWETVRPGGEPIDLLPDADFAFSLDDGDAAAAAPPDSLREQRLEQESLQLAAELAALREAGAERERLLESRLVELAARLEEREAEITDQSAQIASLTLERDGLRARLEHSPTPPPSWLERQPPREDPGRQVASLKARLEERGRALAVAREEIEGMRAERGRLAEALAERAKQVARLLDELNRREARRRFDGDFRSALQRLIGAARRRKDRDSAGADAPAGPAGAPDEAAAEERQFLGAAATETVVIDPPPSPAIPAPAEPVTPPVEPGRATPRRFLLCMEPGSGEAHELTGSRMYVGRAPEAGIHITDTTVSRVHAVLCLDGEQVVVEDAASTNGVFVNGARVRVAVLNDYDTVTFGNVSYLFRLGPAVEESSLRGQ
jgi:hypothetical protein